MELEIRPPPRISIPGFPNRARSTVRMDRTRSPTRRLTAAAVIAHLTPRQGLKLAEDIARLSFRRVLEEEAQRTAPAPSSRRTKLRASKS